MTEKDNRLIQLDGIRGVCALIVAIYHFAGHYEFKGTSLFSNFIVVQGDLFVDFFFVLSGFVISLNYASGIGSTTSFKNYLRKRFIRLYPLLFYTTLVYFLFELAVNLLLPHLLNSQESVSSLVWRSFDSLLFMDSTPLMGATPGLNYPSWSISAEMVSYIVFGLVILYLNKWAKYALGIILCLSALYLMAINSYMETYAWGFLRGITCFVTGYFTYRLYIKYSSKSLSSYWPLALTILTITLLYLRSLMPARELFTLLAIPPAFALVIFCFALSRGFMAKILSGRVFQWLGKISYSIYLNHAILLTLISKGIFNLLKLQASSLNLYAALALYIVAILIYSQLTYKFVELKGKQFLDRTTGRKAGTEEKKPENYKAA